MVESERKPRIVYVSKEEFQEYEEYLERLESEGGPVPDFGIEIRPRDE